MRRGAITCLFILALLIASSLSLGNAPDSALSTGETAALAETPPAGEVPTGLAAGGGGGNGGNGGDGGPGNSLSGDDDDYWDGVNNDEEPPRSQHDLNLILLILEAWMRTEYWLLP
ncbi:hypothetical protein FJ251_02200 [bacterium]|nr:hypothetical protein [bacterium]